jgi:hypothetical protein
LPCRALICEAHTDLADRRPPEDAPERVRGRGAGPDLPQGGYVGGRAGPAGAGAGGNVSPTSASAAPGRDGRVGDVGGQDRGGAPVGERFPLR